MPAHDKCCKKILAYHALHSDFALFPEGGVIQELNFPLLVKSATEDA
jgi:hypothetical protein